MKWWVWDCFIPRIPLQCPWVVPKLPAMDLLVLALLVLAPGMKPTTEIRGALTTVLQRIRKDSCVFGYNIQMLKSWTKTTKCLTVRMCLYKQKKHARINKTTKNRHRCFVVGDRKCCFFQLSIYDTSGSVELLSKCILPQDRHANESLRFSRFLIWTFY